MAIKLYDRSQIVRIDGAFTYINGTAADPSAIMLTVLSPSGVTSSYTYGSSPDTIDKASVGNYYADVLADESGDWYYKWEGTGLNSAVDEGQFMVSPDRFE